jgi:hypothetical protein
MDSFSINLAETDMNVGKSAQLEKGIGYGHRDITKYSHCPKHKNGSTENCFLSLVLSDLMEL